jgi:predicted molibdopterin-dependent oxidoreductase YjgC
VRDEAGAQTPVDWTEALTKTADRIGAAGGPGTVRFILSAHASLEELYLIGRLGSAFGVPEDGVALSWRTRNKPQPPNTKFPVPPVDAPNVKGARDMGFPVGTAADGTADLSKLRKDVEQGRVSALYVFDPGPPGSIGDLSWVAEARRAGKLPLLIVQGVLMSKVAQAADIVLPGASSLEKDATYVNQQGIVQASARALPTRGDAQEDWQILVNLGSALGVTLEYTASAQIRGDIAAAMASNSAYAGLANLSFARPVAARHWLQASNPSERWKWDVMFQDLPPVKFSGRPEATSIPGAIPLQRVD